jgi:hypothetical protein
MMPTLRAVALPPVFLGSGFARFVVNDPLLAIRDRHF